MCVDSETNKLEHSMGGKKVYWRCETSAGLSLCGREWPEVFGDVQSYHGCLSGAWKVAKRKGRALPAIKRAGSFREADVLTSTVWELHGVLSMC